VTVLEFTQVLTSIAAMIAAVVGVINTFKIQTVHKTTNSKMDLLLRTTAAAERAKGRKDAELDAAAIAIDKASE
jgi:phage terminase Nu1 subunit (DNA packaging protein)